MMVASPNRLSMKRMVRFFVSFSRRPLLIFHKAGYTYCAIAALSFLNRLPKSGSQAVQNDLRAGLTNLPATIRWLVSRQLSYEEEEEESDDEDHAKQQIVKLAGVYEEPLVPGLSIEDSQFVGFNGRCNKRADTCYAFWVTASLDVCIWSCQHVIYAILDSFPANATQDPRQ